MNHLEKSVTCKDYLQVRKGERAMSVTYSTNWMGLNNDNVEIK